MPPTEPPAGTILIIKRTFKAPREELFRAWTDPALLKQWFCPGDTYETPFAEADLHVGGAYRIGMKPKTKDIVHIASGTYQEIVPPERLVFTWTLDEEGQGAETLVTLLFRDLGSSTELVLTHERLPDATTRDSHTDGWKGCLANLEKLFPVSSQ